MSDFTLALQGNLVEVMDNRAKAVLVAIYAGTVASSTKIKKDMRNDILKAGLGRRLAFTIQDEIYPKRDLSWYPTALIFSKAPVITSLHTDGGIVQAIQGALAIPIEGGAADNIRRKRGESFVDAFKRKFNINKLDVVSRPGESSMLVAKMRKSKAGKFVKTRSVTPLKRKQGPRISGVETVSVPVFTLVRQARHKKRLRLRQIMAKGARRHPARVAFELRKQLALSNKETTIKRIGVR